jgi:DNA-binding Lrp family transcriptional regulator
VPDIDPLDRQIADQLSRNGRIPNLELARQLGVSEKTVRQRIRRLMERDGMRVVAVFDSPPAQSRLMMMLHSEPGQRFAVAARLAGLPEIDEVHLTTGAYELIAQASFESESDALEFYVRHIESGEGIQSAQSAHVIETISPRTAPAQGVFEEFDAKAAGLTRLSELLDLTCDAATQHMSTGRIAVSGNTRSHDYDGDPPVYGPRLRWRGMSSRYIEMLNTIRRSDSVIIPTVIERGQHVFVADALTDPLFARLADLVASEGFHTFLAVPVRSGDLWVGTMNLYYDTVMPYSEELVARAQELADLLGKHIARIRDAEAAAGQMTGTSS